MTVKAVVAELDKIMQTLQSVNTTDYTLRERNQRSVNKAYTIAEELKKKLKEEHK